MEHSYTPPRCIESNRINTENPLVSKYIQTLKDRLNTRTLTTPPLNNTSTTGHAKHFYATAALPTNTTLTKTAQQEEIETLKAAIGQQIKTIQLIGPANVITSNTSSLTPDTQYTKLQQDMTQKQKEENKQMMEIF